MKLTTSNATVTNTVVSSKLTIGNNAVVVESLSVGNVSINSSAIAVGNVSITPTAVSTPSLILGGTAFVGGMFGGIVNYQEFTANGTWYNPLVNAAANASLTGYEQVFVMAWGGGGGASANNNRTCGGGGGACVTGMYTLSAITNTVSVVVGGGGSAITTTTTALSTATSGSNSSFSSLIAYGGAGGSSGGGGGGGGILAIASTTTGGTPLGGTVAAPGGTSTFGGGGGGTGGSGAGGPSIFGGAGGTGTGTQKGGDSIYGGGGGSGATAGPGLSIFGGNGGESGSNAGKVPGGGGGGQTSPTSVGAGARGEVRVWVIGPGSTTAGAPTYTLTANTTTLYEGSSVLYTVSTTNVANNTTLYYTLNNSSTAVATDFTTAVNGSVVISGGTGTFTLTAVDDSDATNESFRMDIRSSSLTGSIVASNGSVSIVPLPAVSLITRSTTSVDTSAQSTYTFNSMSIGTASTTRRVIALIQADSGSGGAETLNSATIGGISANIDAQAANGTGGSGTVAIVSATIPTGTTATVTATFSGTLQRASCFVIAIDNLQSVTPYDTATDITNPLSTTIDWLKDGYVVAVGATNSDAATYTWTGVTERYETDVGTGKVGGGDLFTTTTATNQTVAMTISGGSPARFALAVASYR
jgi:hypothetical protein